MVTTHLEQFEKIRRESSKEPSAPHFQVKASFEFTYRSDFLALHVCCSSHSDHQALITCSQISHGIEWVSSNILFPKIMPSIPGALYVPVPRIRQRLALECKALDTTPRESPLNVLIRWKSNQYHLFKVDLSEERYQHDVFKAITILHSWYRSSYYKPFSFRRIVGVEYVEVIVSSLEVK